MRALVIGAAGYLGKLVVPALRQRMEVVTADILPVSGLVDHVVDLRFPEQLAAVLRKASPDVVVNLAYLLSEACAINPHMAVRTNIAGVNALFDLCAALEVPRVVYASSASVYGDQADFGDSYVTETTVCRPRTLYGSMKLFNEAMAEHYNRTTRTRFIGVRVSTLQGRGKQGAVPPFDVLVRAVGGGERVILPWSSDESICFIHVDEVAEVFTHLACAISPRWSIYNTGGEHLTIGELAAMAERVCGIHVECVSRQEILTVSRVSKERLVAEYVVHRRSPYEWLVDEVEERRRALKSTQARSDVLS